MAVLISPFYESVFPLYSPLVYVFMIGGILLYSVSIVKLQKEYGYKPRIYPLLLEGAFVRELFSHIRRDNIAITIFSLDIMLYVVGFYVIATE
jgi:hypothetical protein